MWHWKIILSKLVICMGAGLRRDRRNEHEMLRADPGYRSGERRRCTMIDVVINAIIGIFVRCASEMHDSIALREERLPVEQFRNIRKRNGGNVRTSKSGSRPGAGDHLVSLRGEIGNQMSSNEAARARY